MPASVWCSLPVSWLNTPEVYVWMYLCIHLSVCLCVCVTGTSNLLSPGAQPLDITMRLSSHLWLNKIFITVWHNFGSELCVPSCQIRTCACATKWKLWEKRKKKSGSSGERECGTLCFWQIWQWSKFSKWWQHIREFSLEKDQAKISPQWFLCCEWQPGLMC